MTKSHKDKIVEAYQTYMAEKTGTKPKRGAKDGSISMHPVVPCPDLPEREVLKQCLKWLRARRVFCDRHDCGSGPGHARYGIKGGGDIIGILHDGRHFEIECKRGKGGRLSAEQRRRMLAVRKAGGAYVVVHGLPELEYYMEGLI